MKLNIPAVFLTACLSVISVSVFADQIQPTINVLTWWGYLDDPKISKLVTEKCGVKISYDEYYSNDEFLSRFQKQTYDVAIFSQVMYGVIGGNIAIKNSNLSSVSKNYSEFIRHEYVNNRFPNNVAYFTMSIMGFLWNPENIQLKENDDILDAFKKAASNSVVLIDDPMEVNNIMNLAFKKSGVPLNIENMKEMTQSSKVYITTDYGKIYSSKNFAFSYLWSGDAFYDMQQQNYKYKFFVNKASSYICPDLIAQLNEKPASACVAHVLASREVLNIVQNSDYYFSPYGDSTQITDPKFKAFYNKLYPSMKEMSWIPPVSSENFNNLIQEWKGIKLDINNEEN